MNILWPLGLVICFAVGGYFHIRRKLARLRITGTLYYRHFTIFMMQRLSGCGMLMWIWYTSYKYGHVSPWQVLALGIWLVASKAVTMWHNAAMQRNADGMWVR